MTTTIRSAGAQLGQRLRVLVRGRPRSTTRRTLQGLVASLLIVTAIVFVTSLLAFTRVHDTADTVRTRTAPAILEIVAAQTALVRADHAAITSFQTGAMQLAGPGEEFRSQMAIASQSLTRAAEHNIAGETGSRELQLLDGLLVTYTGMIGQADAQDTLGTKDLWNASSLLHTGILTQLKILLNAQKRALDDQLMTSSMTPGAVLVLLGPLVGLFALLVVAHIFLRRRFRRRLNPWLVLATALLVALSAVTSVIFVSQHRLEDTQSTLDRLVTDELAHMDATYSEGQRTLAELVRRGCGNPGRCGATVDRFVTGTANSAGTAAGVNDGQLADETWTVNEQTAAAGANTGLRPLIYLLAILIGAAVFLGFRARLYEYRYRPR